MLISNSGKCFLAIVLCSCALVAARQNAATTKQADPFTFKSKVDVVVVPVLALDAKGNAVGNLKKEDFHLFDQGKQQIISGFTMQMRAGADTATGSRNAEQSKSAVAGTAPSPAPTPRRFVALLFDDLHLDLGQLAQMRKAASQLVNSSLEPTDVVAVLSTSGRTNSGFTQDRAKLQEAIASVRQVRASAKQAEDCIHIDHYLAFMLEETIDTDALDAGAAEVARCYPALGRVAAEVMAKAAASAEMPVGEDGTRATLELMDAVIRQMGALSGQRVLVLLSPGFFAVTPNAVRAHAHVLDTAARASVTISALDARGLETDMLDSSKKSESQAVARFRGSARAAYGGVMDQLAAGTGGTYIHNRNDFKDGLTQLTMPPEYMYLLEFSPNNVKQDGVYHRLKVSVSAKGIKLRARGGYFAGTSEPDRTVVK